MTVEVALDALGQFGFVAGNVADAQVAQALAQRATNEMV